MNFKTWEQQLKLFITNSNCVQDMRKYCIGAVIHRFMQSQYTNTHIHTHIRIRISSHIKTFKKTFKIYTETTKEAIQK